MKTGARSKDINTFVRFGGLNLITQKGYGKDIGIGDYHSPPTRRGFYAMPKVAQERFLVGALMVTQPNFISRNLDNLSEYHKSLIEKECWDRTEKEDKDFELLESKLKREAYSRIRKEFRKTGGYIWHHLVEYVPRNEIILTKGAWVKTTIQAWERAFCKMSINYRYGREIQNCEGGSVSDINQSKGIIGNYSKDHCEVFFDEKV